MPNSSVTAYRARQSQRGLVRVEVTVHREDAALVRGVVSALLDPARRDDARRLLLRKFTAPAAPGLKALLASAPLDGIELERERDFGRDVEL